MSRKTQQNDITSPELLAKVNPKNQKLVKDYLMYLRSIQRSQATIDSYKNDLDIFFVWCLQNLNNKFFADVTKRDIISYQNFLLYENNNSSARVRRLKSTLSSLSNYIEAILDEEPEFKGFRNIIRKVENPVNQPSREKTVFEDNQLQGLLDYLVEKKKYQQACCLALAMYSGRRKTELTRFKVSHFDESNIIYGSLYKTPERLSTKGRGVKGKLLYCYTLSAEFKPYFDLWMAERERLGIDSEWLFVKKNTATGKYEQIKANTLNSWAETFTKILRIDFYWHSLRHYFCTKLARSNIPDNIIQEIVGWESADMVKVYKDISTDEQLSAYFDEGGIKTNVAKSLTDL